MRLLKHWTLLVKCFDGPDSEGVDWLNEREAEIHARILQARKVMGIFDYQQGRPN